MGKVCIACGVKPLEEKKPKDQPEDCPNCGGKDTVREEELESKNEPKQE